MEQRLSVVTLGVADLDRAFLDAELRSRGLEDAWRRTADAS